MQTKSHKGPHTGHNIQTVRLIRGISQTGLAVELEDKMKRPFSQQLISDIENRETVEDEQLLRQIADILHVTPEALKTLDWDSAINVIGSTFTTNDQAPAINQAIHSTINQTINPLDKLIDLFEKEKAELKAEIDKLKKKHK